MDVVVYTGGTTNTAGAIESLINTMFTDPRGNLTIYMLYYGYNLMTV